jgi:hypothetical protein
MVTISLCPLHEERLLHGTTFRIKCLEKDLLLLRNNSVSSRVLRTTNYILFSFHF